MIRAMALVWYLLLVALVDCSEPDAESKEESLTARIGKRQKELKGAVQWNAELNLHYGLGVDAFELWFLRLNRGYNDLDSLDTVIQSLGFLERRMDKNVPEKQREPVLIKLGMAYFRRGSHPGCAHCYKESVRLYKEQAVKYMENVLSGRLRGEFAPSNVRYWANRAIVAMHTMDPSGKRGNKLFKRIVKVPGVGWTNPWQVPTHFSPGLEAKELWDPASFLLTQVLEENWRLIHEDLLKVVDDFKVNITGEYELVDRGSWSQFLLTDSDAEGVIFTPGVCARTPNVCRLLDPVRNPDLEYAARVDGKAFSGTVAFARLDGGTHLIPHTGTNNRRLTLHLPLNTALGAKMFVGANETVEWKEGKVVVFDDSFIHSVKHTGTEPRYILHVNFWHPDLLRKSESKAATTEL